MVVVIASTSAAQWLMNAINNHITYRVGYGHRDEGLSTIWNPFPRRHIDSHQYGIF